MENKTDNDVGRPAFALGNEDYSKGLSASIRSHSLMLDENNFDVGIEEWGNMVERIPEGAQTSFGSGDTARRSSRGSNIFGGRFDSFMSYNSSQRRKNSIVGGTPLPSSPVAKQHNKCKLVILNIMFAACVIVFLLRINFKKQNGSDDLAFDSNFNTSQELVGALEISDTQEENVILPPLIEFKYADVFLERSIENKEYVPFLWIMPKAGGNAVIYIMSKCLGLTLASDAGKAFQSEELNVVTNAHGSFVNVDTSTFSGIEHAVALDVASSGIVDVYASQHIHEMAEMLSQPIEGRIFTIIRHPVDRVISVFYHQQATDMSLKGVPLMRYFNLNKDGNQMTRTLSNNKSGVLSAADFKLAKKILRRKVLVGLVDHIDESIRRFEKVMGWVHGRNIAGCEKEFILPSIAINPTIVRDSPTWKIIEDRNTFDMELYSYALELFDLQGKELKSKRWNYWK